MALLLRDLRVRCQPPLFHRCPISGMHRHMRLREDRHVRLLLHYVDECIGASGCNVFKKVSLPAVASYAALSDLLSY